jgi:ABC-type phosphate/phosphonate transport system ATPase subunit
MVTHDVDIAKGFCTDLVALSQGRVISSGPIDSIPDRCWRALSREESH